MPDTNMPARPLSSSLDVSAITPEYYLTHYMEFLPRYISHGRPSKDTLETYHKRIRMFLEWCKRQNRDPFTIHDYQMRIYLEDYMQSHRDASVSLEIVSIRMFYTVANRIGLIQENPCKHIRSGSAFRFDEQFKYFTMDQVNHILKTAEEEPDDFVRTRNVAMISLMAMEGLRNVELARMNDEDIYWETKTIFIHGKGHAGMIYPSDYTMDTLEKYLKARPKPKKDGAFTPTFISDSHKRLNQRLSRNGIRDIMNKILKAAGYKQKGYSCHIFRHSCGTNLYAATKDLRVVQETLRQRDPKMAARYAHVQERMTKRNTDLLWIESKKGEKEG